MKEIRRDSETAGGRACECYVNTAEIKQGPWQEDPSVCLRNCKEHFLGSVLTEWQGGQGWADGCGILNRGAAVQELWALYWCDLTFCGVGIDPARGLGQDPNVDLIINTCQNIGFYSILDPGPPPEGFRCSTETSTQEICSATIVQVPQGAPSVQPHTTPRPVLTSASTAPRVTTTSSTSSHAQPPPAVVSTHHTSAPPVATSSSTPAASSTTSGSNLTVQGKAAIAVCSVLALILLICFALVCLRRRKRRKASFHRALRSRHGVSDVGPAGSPTPLISPASSAVGTRTILTPPLRLRDRKFLPSILRPGSRSPSPPLTPLTPAYSPQPGGGGGGGGAGVFPSSPICSPTINKLIPRHERSTVALSATSSTVPRSIPYTLTGYSPSPPPPPPPPTLIPPSSSSIHTHSHSLSHHHPPSPSPSSHYPEILSPLATFSIPITAPGSSGGGSNIWPLSSSRSEHAGNNGNEENNNNNRGSAGGESGSSCYTGTGTSTAHSSLRHEIPIGIPLFMGAGSSSGSGQGMASGMGSGSGTGLGSGGEGLRGREGMSGREGMGGRGVGMGSGVSGSVSRSEATPPPPPAPPGSPLPNRPPRPHEGMLEILDLVKPASFSSHSPSGSGSGPPGGGIAVGYGGYGSRAGSGSVGTPPPPPLSPPPTKALPRTPGSPSRGSARNSPAPVPRSPPPPYSSASTVGKGSSPPPYPPRMVGMHSHVPAASIEAGSTVSGIGMGHVYHPHRQRGGSMSYSGFGPQHAAGVASPGPDPRGSWGSWSGTGTVMGSGNYRVDNSHGLGRGVAAAGDRREGGGDGGSNIEEAVSPRLSESSDVTATGGTMVSAVSRMSSMRDDDGGRI